MSNNILLKFSPQRCGFCLTCSSCGKNDVQHFISLNGSEANEDIGVKQPYCATCCIQRRNGNYCPICEGKRNFMTSTCILQYFQILLLIRESH